MPTLSTVNGYIERLRANPNAYTGEVRQKIEWRIGVTGQALRRAIPAGVRIAFGTDAGVSLHGRNADEFLLMVANGMTPMSAIQAATVNAADLLGLASEVGTIEAGTRRRHHRGARRSARRCRRAPADELRDGAGAHPPSGTVRTAT